MRCWLSYPGRLFIFNGYKTINSIYTKDKKTVLFRSEVASCHGLFDPGSFMRT